jgi:hypothetical protein
MTSTTTTSRSDTTALLDAIVRRDADAVTGWYAADATISIVDRDHPPASPQVIAGRDAISTYFHEICGRNIDHTVPVVVADAGGLAFEQHCRYPEGTLVVCVTVATVVDGLITRQTIAQSWD